MLTKRLAKFSGCLIMILTLLGLSMPANAEVFKVIDFEVSEGYAAGAAWPSGQNITSGPDFADTNYASADIMVWNGQASDWHTTGNYGVASGTGAMLFDGNWAGAYSRTPSWAPIAVPQANANDRYFTFQWAENVLHVNPADGNDHIPAKMTFGVNGFEANPVSIYHNYAGDTTSAAKIHVNAGGSVSLDQVTYQYRTWVESMLKYDLELDQVTYYYDGVEVGTYALGADITSWESFSISFYAGNRDGAMAVDNIRIGTVPEPATLSLLGCGVLFAIRRRR